MCMYICVTLFFSFLPFFYNFFQFTFEFSFVKVVQYEGVEVFQTFVDDIADARRAADGDPDLEIQGACAKLTGVLFIMVFVLVKILT